jgi:hypothetical protein
MHVGISKMWAILRLLAAGAIAAAVVAQFVRSSQFESFDPINFFSYFTILSNIFIAVVFAISAFVTLRGKKFSLALECARGAATLYMVTTGIIFALLLSQYPLGLTMPWVNSVLHQIIPVFAALDWLLMPPGLRIPPKLWWSWLSFPIAYVIYTLLRGPHVGWYPYPFLDPKLDGYGRVAVYCVGISLCLTLLMWIVGWTGNKLGSNSSPKKSKPARRSKK